MIATSAHPPAFHAAAYALGPSAAGHRSRPEKWLAAARVGLPVLVLGPYRAGWVLTTAVVAGLTGILKRD